jgi:hypothetical protein
MKRMQRKQTTTAATSTITIRQRKYWIRSISEADLVFFESLEQLIAAGFDHNSEDALLLDKN